jgi:hypothetical protein
MCITYLYICNIYDGDVFYIERYGLVEFREDCF